MPHLDAFLSRHIRPDHPLRHHPLWLSERDLLTIPNVRFDYTSLQKSGKKGAAVGPDSVIAQVPNTSFLFNMDQLLPESEVRWQLPVAATPMSVSSMQPYKQQMQSMLECARRARGFESNWWGTRRRWLLRGGQVAPQEQAFPLRGFFITRLLHISLLANAEDILRHSFISGKTGLLLSWWNMDTVPGLDRDFRRLVEAHFLKHGFQTPLYFSKAGLRRAGIAVRPDADPLDFYEVNLRENNERASSTSAIAQSMNTYQQYYHLSQLILPENYRISPAVLEAEQLNPGLPIHGITGKLLELPELQYEAMRNSTSPELASLIARDSESGMMCSAADLQSPSTVRGRSLWYLPHDVLEVGGLVDVNAVPVEVSVPNTSSNGGKCLYNVEQLLLPLEGYKVVGCIACVKSAFPEAEPQPPRGGTDADADADVDADAQEDADDHVFAL
ncbi:hypothetical protein DQ04_09471010 [Trypanosoma grayi]|uniref:hypothetical protein n=1 Tax=Trypanosoma grayi TaxID=71804 RepID=UPI0004F3F842|nr:hypothetical protein DQ04_09471010 [Trypanosoma grayi]KEG07548.1 hypothetical protein DQ04_09471010 [Trypanosoma grayi]